MTNQATANPFAHLGPAPYRLIGVEVTEDRVANNAALASAGKVFTTNMCGGSCDHCGTAIWNVFRFRAADGAKFKVGADCAQKVAYELGDSKMVDDVKRAQLAHQRKIRAARAAKAKAAKLAKSVREILANPQWSAAANALADAAAPGTFAAQFAVSLQQQLQQARALSPKQVELLAKLIAEAAE